MIKEYLLRTHQNIRGENCDEQFFQLKKLKNTKQLKIFTDNYLKDLLLHAYNKVPYYHSIFKNEKIVENGTVDLSKFDRIPILTKKILRKNYKNLIATDYKKRKPYVNYSGGSTGEPIKFYLDKNYNIWRNASNNYYYKEILNINEPTVKKVILWGSTRDIFRNNIDLKNRLMYWINNITMLHSYKMNEEQLKKYIRIINKKKPDLIRGFSGSLYELCRYAKKNNIELHTPSIIISAAETLKDYMREEIEETFETKLYDFYGSRELNGIAGECKKGSMHMFSFNNRTEILDDNFQQVKENEHGRIIVTNLHNYTMPFIRYEIGDTAVLGSSQCSCGNVLPILKEITGRLIDHFVKENGEVVSSLFFIYLFDVYYNKQNISKFQVIQEDYKKIRIRIVPHANIFDKDKRDINNKIRKVFGTGTKIIWEIVDELPKTKTGKYIFTKCLIRN